MGIAYYGNYLRWFELGRSSLFRAIGVAYGTIEKGGLRLPVSEVFCKYQNPLHYDDLLTIEATLDTGFRAGMKFDYRLLYEDQETVAATGYTKHAFLDQKGKIVRPPAYLRKAIADNSD